MIELRDVRKSYRRGSQEIRALDGVTLDIEAGELVAITGPSGSGKSTLLHLIGALDTPTSGEIRVAGAALSGASDAALTAVRRDKLGFVFQFFNLLPTMTARENVMLPALLDGAPAAQAARTASALLARVGLAGRADHRPDELSGGEMQRVAIARALVKSAPLLLADEPTGNLDSAAGQEVLSLLRSLQKDGLTVLLVTHDPSVAAAADRVLRVRDGRVVADEPTAGPASR